MRSDYHERRESRIERLEERATKAAKEAGRRDAAARERADRIPLGQPILVGHHSERHARRDRDYIWDNTSKAVEAQEKSDELWRRAEAARSNTAISSDDPDALEKLREKVARLEAQREKMKAANTEARKAKRPAPHERWELSNLGATIRSTKLRLRKLEGQLHRAQVCSEETVGRGTAPTDSGTTDWRLVANHEENRIQLFFDDRPAREVCRELGSRGFRWARSVGAWQRHLSGCSPDWALWLVEQATKQE